MCWYVPLSQLFFSSMGGPVLRDPPLSHCWLQKPTQIDFFLHIPSHHPFPSLLRDAGSHEIGKRFNRVILANALRQVPRAPCTGSGTRISSMELSNLKVKLSL
jgi:hypothetical protein